MSLVARLHAPRSHRPRRAALATVTAVVAALTLTLAGCSSSSNGDGSGSGSSGGATGTTGSSTVGAGVTDSFPVTIKGALGTATIPAEPKRVVTWGWSAQDAALALGVVPVAMPKYTYGGNKDGVLPWDAQQLTKLGAATPTLLSGGDTGQVPFEEIVAAKPDVILAPYSGLTQKDYDTLSKIAPVVAYPDKPWATSWQDVTTIVGKALGRSAQAEHLIKDTDAGVTALGHKHPGLSGKSFVFSAANQPGQLTIYRATDPRVQLLTELGMVVSPSVKALDTKPSDSYFYTISDENASKVDSDLLVAYFDNQKAADTFSSDPLIANMSTVKSGGFAPIVGESYAMAVSAPSVLSIPWVMPRYVPQLAAAAQKVQ